MLQEAEDVEYDLGPWKGVVKGSRKEFGGEEWETGSGKENKALLEQKLQGGAGPERCLWAETKRNRYLRLGGIGWL